MKLLLTLLLVTGLLAASFAAQALAVLKTEPGLDVQLLVVDYDAEVALKQALKVRTQSTLIVYRGTVERARPIRITAAEDIRAAAL